MVVVTRSGGEVNFGDIPKEDAPMVLDAIHRLASVGMSDEIRRAVSAEASERRACSTMSSSRQPSRLRSRGIPATSDARTKNPTRFGR